jgi:hypothetical protein
MVEIAEQRLQVGDLEWFYREATPCLTLAIACRWCCSMA